MMLSRGARQVTIIGFITNVLAIVALGLRLWSRRIQKSRLAFNDYMAIMATVLTTGIVACCIAGKDFT